MTSTKVLLVVIVFTMVDVVYMAESYQGANRGNKPFVNVIRSLSLRDPLQHYPLMFKLNPDQMKELCRENASIVAEYFGGTFELPRSDNYFVPAAQLYDSVYFITPYAGIRCPTFPPLYIFDTEKGPITDRYMLGILNPNPDYAFEYESALKIVETEHSKIDKKSKDENEAQSKGRKEHSPLEHHLLLKMIDIDREQRWHICNKAQHLIRYTVNKTTYAGNGDPKIYQFFHSTGPSEIDVAFRCFWDPEIYIRVSRWNTPKVFLITLVERNSLKLKELPLE